MKDVLFGSSDGGAVITIGGYQRLQDFFLLRFAEVRHPDGIIVFVVLEENAFNFRILLTHIIPLFARQAYCCIIAIGCNLGVIMHYAVKISCDKLCIECK